MLRGYLYSRTAIWSAAAILTVLVAVAFFTYHRVTAADFSSCPTAGDLAERHRCWDSAIKLGLDKGGVTQALGQLKFFSTESPDFVQTCHTLAHQVGEKAYKDFVVGRALTLSTDTQVCDFGFYHGFMTSFLVDSRDYAKLGTFCTTLTDTDPNGDLYALRWACFHGIGHGSVAESEVSAWADGTHKPLTDTLGICKMAAQSRDDYVKCAAGAYNGMSYGSYKEVIDPKDPYKLCRQLRDSDIPAECYANFASNVFNFTRDRTIVQAIALASTYTPHEYLLAAIPTFANMASRELDTARDFTCMQLQPDEVSPCLNGFVSGLVQLETPETKERRAFALCASDLVGSTMRAECYRDALEVLTNFWTKARTQASCDLAVPRDKHICQDALSTSVH